MFTSVPTQNRHNILWWTFFQHTSMLKNLMKENVMLYFYTTNVFHEITRYIKLCLFSFSFFYIVYCFFSYYTMPIFMSFDYFLQHTEHFLMTYYDFLHFFNILYYEFLNEIWHTILWNFLLNAILWLFFDVFWLFSSTYYTDFFFMNIFDILYYDFLNPIFMTYYTLTFFMTLYYDFLWHFLL